MSHTMSVFYFFSSQSQKHKHATTLANDNKTRINFTFTSLRKCIIFICKQRSGNTCKLIGSRNQIWQLSCVRRDSAVWLCSMQTSHTLKPRKYVFRKKNIKIVINMPIRDLWFNYVFFKQCPDSEGLKYCAII